MKMSLHGLALLTEWEGGPRPHVYLDSGGAPTIGVGHLLTLEERRSGKIVIDDFPVRYSAGLTAPQMDVLLAQDLRKPERAIGDCVHVALTANQADTLTSFNFNIGTGPFYREMQTGNGCRLLRRLNRNEYVSVPEELSRWVFDNGVVVPGLVNRRRKEAALWKGEA